MTIFSTALSSSGKNFNELQPSSVWFLLRIQFFHITIHFEQSISN